MTNCRAAALPAATLGAVARAGATPADGSGIDGAVAAVLRAPATLRARLRSLA